MTTNNFEPQFLRAYQYLETGEVCNARMMLDEILLNEPAYARAHYLMGWIYLNHMADYKKAEKHFKLCRQYEPNFAPNYTVYADVLTIQDKLDDLISLATDSLSVPGIDRSYMFYQIARAKETRENYREALRFIKKSKKYSTSPDWMLFINKEKSRISRKIGFFRQIAALL